MKTIKVYLMMLLCLIFVIGCSKDDDDLSSDELIVNQITDVEIDSIVYLTIPGDYKKSVNYTFTYPDDWVITGIDDDSRFAVTPKSGKAGENIITISAKDYNCSDTLSTTSFTITPINKTDIENIDVCVFQKPVLDLDERYIQANPKGDTLYFKVNPDIEINDTLRILFNYMEDAMMEKCVIDGMDIEIVIKPNETDKMRRGFFTVYLIDSDGRIAHSGMCRIEQPSESSISKDMYTEDGKVTRLLSHTKGKGIPIVIMGDGFLDVDIASGKYRSVTKRAADAIFDRFPMSCLKEYFDVYEVTAVSYNNYFSNLSSTAFNCSYGDRRTIDGDWSKILRYTSMAIGEERFNDAVVLTLLNDSVYAGSCTLTTIGEVSDIPSGLSVAYMPIGDSDFDYLVNHEAVGHGFAKLADEYTEFEGEIPSSDVDFIKRFQSFGLYRNVAFSSDVTKSYWAQLAADNRYAQEKLGCYEGAHYYPMGIWRPTETSIMEGFVDDFNAIGRLMIYKRCMSLAYGDKWKYSYDDFVNFEKANAYTYASLSKAKTRSASKRRLSSCVRIVESPKYSQR